ncbi:hypothetical protein SERLADRAFT_414154 [Serpula lacrymans var. lacrymans S7.9]|uniref:GATA-type domain-containing protein n=1 Tax=Serpula lacrymans var. lacrymans (strain S7.9) TaxID=578457 RepID=F8NMW3_SERL9|nr:uncharacterized protein SERLADRAFT_414154 [Serpula lacrymans var. lacrymans S7.9]EGO27938.1 hypothetical protein SERLADRAFT_414154 [Serpula lacrymans var. lacrymans S7.9]
MDSLQFETYTSDSDSSTPRTPSPRSIDVHPPYKHIVDPIPPLFADSDHLIHHDDSNPFWPQYSFTNSSRGSLLQELYDHDIPPTDMYIDDSQSYQDWSYIQQQQQQQQHHHHHPQQHHFQQHQQNRADHTMIRRATFPYDQFSHPPLYADQIAAEPAQDAYVSSSSPHSYHDYPEHHSHVQQLHHHSSEGIKLEDPSPVIVPSQIACYPRHPSSHPGLPMSYLSPHTGVPVQHTDDAASKETQYLRRRCFNCHTTEPPSWRRSTLNPGKIVCNKCGLYERTHLRPRPLRFDELRAGNKARKAATQGTVKPASGTVPKDAKNPSIVKKEPRECGLARRSSVSSSASSVHSGSATSDWDDSVSVYSSSGSAPPSNYSSPAAATFPIPRSSQSPPMSSPGHPRDGGIRLPNAPLSDIASLQASMQQSSLQVQGQSSAAAPSPRKAATVPIPPSYYAQQHDQYRRGSMPTYVSSPPMQSSSPAGMVSSPAMHAMSVQEQADGMDVSSSNVPLSELSSAAAAAAEEGVRS